MTNPHAIIEGAEPWEHTGPGPHGVLVLHGFTGNPASMRGLAEAMAAAGHHVAMPLLPGHGTIVDDMLPKRWADWAGAADAAYARLAARSERVVVAGLSMGGALTLRLGADHPEIAGLVCVNPAVRPLGDEMVQAVDAMLEAGSEVMPGIGSDIADPESHEKAYSDTPLRALLSLVHDGLAPLAGDLGSIAMPLLLLSSPQDHVVEPAQSDFLAATYGGPVERVSLERSYHVATQDYDKDLINERAVEFVERVTRS